VNFYVFLTHKKSTQILFENISFHPCLFLQKPCRKPLFQALHIMDLNEEEVYEKVKLEENFPCEIEEDETKR
jgi:hypothetical protein